MDFRSLFTDHPASVGEGYFEHLLHAAGFAVRMMLGAIACLVHAVFPFLFVRTGSRVIEELNEHMILRRRGLSPSKASAVLGRTRPV